VRNAIQALQEMKTPSAGVGASFNALSNPNLARSQDHFSGNGVLARSSSHPPEMFCWDENSAVEPLKQIRNTVDAETQTENGNFINEYVLQNPEKILELLGLKCGKLRQIHRLKKSQSVSEEGCGDEFYRHKKDSNETCCIDIAGGKFDCDHPNYHSEGESSRLHHTVPIFENFSPLHSTLYPLKSNSFTDT
ncbi:hypothetical protein HHI36_007420, partial [Cryptolaemus montrouzieri]